MRDASKYYGRRIVNASLSDDKILLTFDDGVILCISDEGQSCCEYRHMTCDDDIRDLIGKTLTSIEVNEVCPWQGTHDIAFLEIKAGDEMVSVASHNEHNGFYSGFAICFEEIK